MPPGAVSETPDGWCVQSSALSRWLGIGVKPVTSGSVLMLSSDEKLPIELEMERTEEGGTLLRALAVAGERVFPLRERGMQVVSYKPLWLLSEQTIFQLDAPADGFVLFQENPVIEIPTDEEQAFFEKHLPYLAERFPLRGDTPGSPSAILREPSAVPVPVSGFACQACVIGSKRRGMLR